MKGKLTFQLLRMPAVIYIEEAQPLAPPLIQGQVARHRRPTNAFNVRAGKHQTTETGIVRYQIGRKRTTTITGAVIYQQTFPVTMSLGLESISKPWQKAARISVRRDDRDQEISATGQ